MEIGRRVRVTRSIDLGDDFRVTAGEYGILESTTNGPYLHYLVRLPHTNFAAAEGEIADADGDPE
jgi:hypothetical protein